MTTINTNYYTNLLKSVPSWYGFSLRDGGIDIKQNGITRHYETSQISGRKNQIFVGEHSGMPTCISGESVFFPSANTTIQVSSDSINDAVGQSHAQNIFVIGYDSSFNIVSEIIPLSGLTGSVSASQYFRIINGVVASSSSLNLINSTNDGNLYISPSTSLLSSGVPPTNEKMAVALPNEGIFITSYITIPPGRSAFLTELNYSVPASETNGNIVVQSNIKLRSGSGPFITLSRLASRTSVPSFDFENTTSANIIQNSSNFTDIAITCDRLSGNTDNILLTFLGGFLIAYDL